MQFRKIELFGELDFFSKRTQETFMLKIKNNKTLYLFSGSTMFYSMVLMISNLIVIRWVNPELMGLWGTIILFQTYSFFLQLGTLSGLGRELPFYLGKNENEKALSLAGTASFLSLICMGIVFFLTLISLIYFIIKGAEYYVLVTISVVGVSSAINFYQNYLIVTFRSNKSFNRLSKVYFIQSIIISLVYYLFININIWVLFFVIFYWLFL
jgi:O-antigen/teichoic acid export membrane protein